MNSIVVSTLVCARIYMTVQYYYMLGHGLTVNHEIDLFNVSCHTCIMHG